MSDQNHIYDSVIFKHFVSKKKTIILFLTLFFLCYYLSLPLLTTFFPHVMNVIVIGGIPLSWFFALSQFLVTGVICIVYYKKAKAFDRTVETIKNEVFVRGKNV